MWAVYVAEAEKYDKALIESWKRDMEGMLIFVRTCSVRKFPNEFITVYVGWPFFWQCGGFFD
jgi:hypothetical protein